MKTKCSALVAVMLAALLVPQKCSAAPSVEDILNELGGGGGAASLDSLTQRIIAFAMSIVHFLQALALPGAAILLIIAAGMYGVGSLGHNDALKRQAVGLAISTCVAFTLIKIAPVLVAVIYHGINQ